jgi:hypothetical protein
VDRVEGINSNDVDHTNFIEVLFCEAISDSTSGDIYPYPIFNYKFRKIDDPYSWDSLTRRRSRVYPSTTTYYICDKEATNNIFSLTSQDLNLITKLLQFKQTGSTIIDDMVYEDLTSNLSKLIYLYLDFKINNDYSLYNNSNILADSSSLLENIFEYYLIQEIFKKVSE